MNSYEVLQEAIDFACEQLEVFKTNHHIENTTAMVTTALYRKVIELSSGVSISAAAGLAGPADINFRGLLEASLALEYILQIQEKTDARAIAYKVGYHKQQIHAAPVPEALEESVKLLLTKALEYHQEKLKKEEFREVLSEFNRLHESNRQGHLPKWFSLDNGPRSVNQLANELDKENVDKALVSNLYGLLSQEAHMYLALNGVMEYEDATRIKPVHSIFNPAKDDYNLVAARSLLLSAMDKFTKSQHPEYTLEVKKFLEKIKPHLSY